MTQATAQASVTSRMIAVEHITISSGRPFAEVRRKLEGTVPKLDTRIVEALRVCPKSLGGIAEFSKHEADGSELEESDGAAIEILPILGQSAATVQPSECTFDDPTPG